MAPQVVKVYEVGAWFTPCIFDDERCHLDLISAKVNGSIDLSRLAGYHRYQGTWKPCMGECFKDRDHRTKGEQNPLQGNVGDPLVTPTADEDAQRAIDYDGELQSDVSVNAASQQDTAGGDEVVEDPPVAPATSLMKRAKSIKPHRRKAGS